MRRVLWTSMSLAAVLVFTACGGGDSSGSDAGTDGCGYSPSCSAPSSGELRWVSIPAGSYDMGCSAGDEQCDEAEMPVHSVQVEAFAMSETPITQAQYEAQMGNNPSNFSSCADCPVETVKWYEAQAFCESIGARLPSEAEWEYAARAGSSSTYYSGDDDVCLDAIAWYGDNSSAQTQAVGQKLGNDFCLFDMVGNVWEWVEDCWHDDYTGAPGDGSAWVEEDCTYRVLRGGSFGGGAVALRSSNRNGDYPDMYFFSYPTGPGFRCAKDD